MVALPGHQTSGSPASGWTTPFVPPGMMALWGSWREWPHADTTASCCCGPAGTDGPLPPQGKDERCQVPPTRSLPSPRQGKARQSQRRPSRRLPCPLLPSQGRMNPPCCDGEAEGDAMRQWRLWRLLPFIRSTCGARVGAAPRRAAAPRQAVTRR